MYTIQSEVCNLETIDNEIEKTFSLLLIASIEKLDLCKNKLSLLELQKQIKKYVTINFVNTLKKNTQISSKRAFAKNIDSFVSLKIATLPKQ